MKICPKCNTTVSDDATFCTGCGVQFATSAPVTAVPYYDPYDHTTEFDAKDISDNKVIAMLTYLIGPIGIIIALLAANNSPYAAFHVRQALKITVVEILSLLCAAIFFWTVIVPIACGVFAIVLAIVKIICFFQICSGKAKEPAIVRGFEFLR